MYSDGLRKILWNMTVELEENFFLKTKTHYFFKWILTLEQLIHG